MSARRIEIEVVEPGEPGRRYRLSSAEVVLGRHPANLVVLRAPHVSAQHGCFRVGENRIEYQDLGSRNGSRLRRGNLRIPAEGNLSSPIEVRDGDEIELGGGSSPILVRVRVEGAGTEVGKLDEVGGTVLDALPFREVESVPAELAADAAALRSLYGLSLALQEARDGQTLIERLAESALEALDRASCVRVYLRRQASGEFRLSLARSRESGPAPELGSLPSQAILDRVLGQGLSVLFADAQREFEHSESVKLAGIQSGMCVPLWDRREVKGLIQVDSSLGPGLFDRRALEILTLFGNHAAVALANLELTDRLRQAEARLAEENLQLKHEVERTYRSKEMLGRSPALRAVVRLMEKVAPTHTTVLILGETGTGKELVASGIHYASPRRNAVFVARNCRELSETLLESELFGHKKGSFTGASSDRKGLFELADRGTIFLDEAADIPPSVQAKLLRVLQEGEVWPIGDTRPRKVDVRVISATNRDLAGEVRAGRFREDLYFRLNVFPIVVPPLRERREDIPLLAELFLERYRRKAGKEVRGIDPAAMEQLSRCHFPGNIRQLESTIERAVALAEPGEPIRLEHLPDELRLPSVRMGLDGLEAEALAGSEEAVSSGRGKAVLKTALERFEAKLLTEALAKRGGHQTATALYLGISRMALINKMKKYGLR